MNHDVLALDDLDRAGALLDTLDASQTRLDSDIATVDALRDGLAIGGRARGGENASIDFLRYIEELELSNDADLREVAGRLRAAIGDHAGHEMTAADILQAVAVIETRDMFARLGIVDESTFIENVRQELVLHQRCNDSLAVFTVEIANLSAADERLMGEALAEMSQHPGDVLGRTGPGFAFCIPWTDQREAVQFDRAFREIAQHTLPDHELAFGLHVGIPTPDASVATFARPQALPAAQKVQALGGGRTR